MYVLHASSATPQDLQEKVSGLEAACGSLEREQSEACLLVKDLRRDVEGADTAAADMRRDNQRQAREITEVYLMPFCLLPCWLPQNMSWFNLSAPKCVCTPPIPLAMVYSSVTRLVSD